MPDNRNISQTGLSINFHLHYLDALKKNLIAIAVVISLLIVLIIRIAVRQGHLPLRNVSNAIKSITSENLDARLEPTRVPIELERLDGCATRCNNYCKSRS